MSGKIKNFDILVSEYTKEIVGKIPPKFIIYGSSFILLCLIFCLIVFSNFPIEKKVIGDVSLSKNYDFEQAIYYTNALEASNEIKINDTVKIYPRKQDLMNGEYLIGIIDSIELITIEKRYKSYLSLPNGLKTNKNNSVKMSYDILCTGEVVTSRQNLIQKILNSHF